MLSTLPSQKFFYLVFTLIVISFYFVKLMPLFLPTHTFLLRFGSTNARFHTNFLTVFFNQEFIKRLPKYMESKINTKGKIKLAKANS